MVCSIDDARLAYSSSSHFLDGIKLESTFFQKIIYRGQTVSEIIPSSTKVALHNSSSTGGGAISIIFSLLTPASCNMWLNIEKS